eukprot:scaffold3674_cov75-Cylindrotheca_fusiformis.AAC.2
MPQIIHRYHWATAAAPTVLVAVVVAIVQDIRVSCTRFVPVATGLHRKLDGLFFPAPDFLWLDGNARKKGAPNKICVLSIY